MAMSAEYSPRLSPAANAGFMSLCFLNASNAAMVTVTMAGCETAVFFSSSDGPSKQSLVRANPSS